MFLLKNIFLLCDHRNALPTTKMFRTSWKKSQLITTHFSQDKKIVTQFIVTHHHKIIEYEKSENYLPHLCVLELQVVLPEQAAQLIVSQPLKRVPHSYPALAQSVVGVHWLSIKKISVGGFSRVHKLSKKKL